MLDVGSLRERSSKRIAPANWASKVRATIGRLPKQAIDRCPADPEPVGELAGTNAFRLEGLDLGKLRPRRGSAPLVCAGGLASANAFSLALQHQLALELGEGSDHSEEHPASRGRGVDAEIEGCAA